MLTGRSKIHKQIEVQSEHLLYRSWRTSEEQGNNILGKQRALQHK